MTFTPLLFALTSSLIIATCGPVPTKSTLTQQRKTPFFKVLVYEMADTAGGGSVSFILFEDEAENCYITSGVDGGVVVAPSSACLKAKELVKEDIEVKDQIEEKSQQK